MRILQSIIAGSGGRRFVMALGAGIVATGLLVLGYIEQITWRDTVLGTVTVYIAGNTAQKFSNGTTSKTTGDRVWVPDPYANS